jgi:hypothetical protein
LILATLALGTATSAQTPTTIHNFSSATDVSNPIPTGVPAVAAKGAANCVTKFTVN